MAKCVAVMHGFEDGPIVNVDVQIGQFFRGSDGMIKIVDFNRAEPLMYDMHNKKYCKWTNGEPTDGQFRSPEENTDASLTEKIDVYSLGNVFYTLLTGAIVWEDTKLKERRNLIIEGATLKIPKYVQESSSSRALANVILDCWTLDAENRPSIFDVVCHLEDAVRKQKIKLRNATQFG